MLKEAKIVTNHGHSTIDCILRDISTGGARLKVENGLAVPGRFDLLLVSENTRLPAQVVWRKPNEVGVCFAPAKASEAA
ncbi:MAG TPA: PilZ domain-containing protein [Afifellaceae bacterium]|nr:PilZ domain-containing protein [Afifellaceae bacterium]